MANRGPRRTRGQRERDWILVSELYLRGTTQEEIARQVSAAAGYDPPLTRQQIGYDIKKLLGRWQDRQMLNMTEALARELARIDHLEREAWDAWERSKEDAQTITSRATRTGSGGVNVQTIEKTEGQTGDASFLHVVKWCIEQRCNLLGLASLKVDLTGGGQAVQCAYVEVILDDSPLEGDDLGENLPE